jgi:hypothetical protein
MTDAPRDNHALANRRADMNAHAVTGRPHGREEAAVNAFAACAAIHRFRRRYFRF